jgi:antitoxin FitA
MTMKATPMHAAATRGGKVLPALTSVSHPLWFFMATITLKNVPEGVHAALKERARRHKRSLNQEAIFCLDLALGRRPRDPQTLLEEIRDLRSRISTERVTLDWIHGAKREGRS